MHARQWACLKNGGVARSGATGADYFGALVAVFQREATGAGHAHLAAFHALVPALTLAAVEAALLSKEALARQRRGGPAPKEAGFTDDGFALGLAYLLKVPKLAAAQHPDSRLPTPISHVDGDWMREPAKHGLACISSWMAAEHCSAAPPVTRWGSQQSMVWDAIAPGGQLNTAVLPPPAQVLRQDEAFDALQWFDAVRAHYAAERARLKVLHTPICLYTLQAHWEHSLSACMVGVGVWLIRRCRRLKHD